MTPARNLKSRSSGHEVVAYPCARTLASSMPAKAASSLDDVEVADRDCIMWLQREIELPSEETLAS
jgi:hypothetical protein